MREDHRGQGGVQRVPSRLALSSDYCHYHYHHYRHYLDRGVGQVHDDPQLVHLLHHCLQIEGIVRKRSFFNFFVMRIFRIGARNGSDIPGQNSLAAINLSRLSRSSGLLIPIRSSGGSECQVHKQTSHSALSEDRAGFVAISSL